MSRTTDQLKNEKFVRAPQWFFRQFLPNVRNLTQVKIVAEIINQTRGYQKSEDLSALSHLAKSMKMSRSAVSANLQILIEAGVIYIKNEAGKDISEPMARKQSGNQRLKTIFSIPVELDLTEDKLTY